jgi:hypothetical protein
MMAADGLQDVPFGATFAETPAIFGSVMSYDGPQAATLRFGNVNPSGFSIGMQEQESLIQTHVSERLGWIAIESGVGATSDGRRIEVGRITASSDAVAFVFDRKTTRRFPSVISSLSSYNGTDTAWASQQGLSNAQVQVFVREERSSDSETSHISETISVFVAE